MNCKYYFIARYTNSNPIQFGPFHLESQVEQMKEWLVKESKCNINSDIYNFPVFSSTWSIIE